VVASQVRKSICALFMPEIEDWESIFSEISPKEIPFAVVTHGRLQILRMPATNSERN
jgi:hypothetical protein